MYMRYFDLGTKYGEKEHELLDIIEDGKEDDTLGRWVIGIGLFVGVIFLVNMIIQIIW